MTGDDEKLVGIQRIEDSGNDDDEVEQE